MQTGSGKWLAFLTIPLMLTACGGGGGGTAATPAPIPITTTAFTTWRTDLASKAFQLDGEGNQVSGVLDANSNFSSVGDAEAATAGALFTFDSSSNLSGLFLTSTTSTASKTEGFAGAQITSLAEDINFLNATSTTSKAIISDPKSLGWDYQSFGVWETGLDTSDSRALYAISVGTPTAGTAIPGSGTADFTGKVVGSYVSAGGLGHTVLADLSVAADFGSQSLVFNTTNTRISADGVTYTGTSSLDLSGSLGYGIGNNSISGTLTTTGGSPLTGNSTGQFYGPAAEELGGVFFLKNPSDPLSVETYSGAYGAKR
jgi:hypothetical protein